MSTQPRGSRWLRAGIEPREFPGASLIACPAAPASAQLPNSGTLAKLQRAGSGGEGGCTIGACGGVTVRSRGSSCILKDGDAL